jgi:HlyD family secretion protein
MAFRPYRCLSVAAFVLLAACGAGERQAYQGYAEGEFVRVAAPFAGTLQRIEVKRGMQVKAGDPLFVLEQENEAAARREAEERLKNAEATLADLKKAKRPPEIAAVAAQLDQAEANLRLSRVQLERDQKLLVEKFVSQARVDESRARFEADQARVVELRAQVATANLAARSDEILAAEHSVAAAQAVLEQNIWKLAQKTVASTVTGLVQDTLFVTGEWVPAGAAVVSLLPPENIKVRFFVPQAVAGGLRAGQAVRIRCDGCGEPIAAQVTYIAPQTEYTPPVIYSRESRAKLVFMIEARTAPADAPRLHPGQPVEVDLAP